MKIEKSKEIKLEGRGEIENREEQGEKVEGRGEIENREEQGDKGEWKRRN